MYYQNCQRRFSASHCPINQLWDIKERWPQTTIWFQAQTFSSRKVSQTLSRIDKGQLQMLDLLSSEAICKSLLPLKTIFLGGRKAKLFSSLELLWHFAVQCMCKKWSWFRQEMASSSQYHVCISRTRESSQSFLGSLFCKTHCSYLRRLPLEKEDSWCTASHPSSLF